MQQQKNIDVEIKKRVEGSIASIAFCRNELLILDNAYNLYIFDKKELTLIKNSKLSKNYEPAHRFSKAFDICSKHYLNIPLQGSSSSALLEYSGGLKRLANLKWHSADIEVSKFASNFPYLATGGADGKIFLFDVPSGNLILSFPNKPDYISCIDFGKRNELIAIGSFDNSVSIFDITRNKLLGEFRLDDVIEDCKFFNNDKKVFAVTRKGTSAIFDIKSSSIESKKTNFADWPTVIEFTEDDSFALIGSRQRKLFIIKIETNSVALELELSSIGVVNLKFHEDRLYVGYIDGSIEIINYYKNKSEFEEFINKREFKEARALLDVNVFLKTHPLMNKFNESWEHVSILAITLIAQNKGSEAYELVNPFLDDPKKNEQFQFFLQHKNHIVNFVESVRKKDLLVAYDLLEDNSFLKSLPDYADLEEFWNKCFNVAKKLLQEDPELNKNKAMQILKPFIPIPHKKSKVYNLLNNASKFLDADNAVKVKDFKRYYSLTETFPFLKDTDLYEKVRHFGDGLFIKMSEHELRQEYKNALAIARTLQHFVPFSEDVVEKVKMIKAKVRFLNAVEEKNERDAYEQVEKNPELKILPQFLTLVEKFKTVLESANFEAFQGYPEKTIDKLRVYLEIPYWSEKVASVIKVAYINEMKDKAKSKDVHWEYTLNEYVRRFGVDSEIEQLCREINQTATLKELRDNADPKGYAKYDFIPSIIIEKTKEEKLASLNVDSIV